jgi:CHAT domain-containing protein/tetratricopeptide (TPR) repeat protein
MQGPSLPRAIILIIVMVLAIGLAAPSVKAQQSDNLASLNQQVVALYGAGKYAEATDVAKRSLAVAEQQYGPEHPAVSTALNNLAMLYGTQARYAEAEPLYKRSLAISEKVVGADHPFVAVAINNLATLYANQARYAEAEPLVRRALAIREKELGRDHPDVAVTLNNLASIERDLGRYEAAEPLYERSLEILERALGPDDRRVATALDNLGQLYREQGRYTDAATLFARAIGIAEKALGPDHHDVGIPINDLAGLYSDQGRYSDAEPLYKRALAITEKSIGPDHPGVGTALNNLAALYSEQGRYAEAEPLYKRALVITEKALGPDHLDASIRLNNLALLYQRERRYADAEPLYRRAIAIMEKTLGPDHLRTKTALNNLALLYDVQGRYADAEPLYDRALAIAEKALGPEHPSVGISLNNLGEVYRAEGRYADAERLYKRALAIDEKTLGPDHPDVDKLLNNLAILYFAQNDWAHAADYWRASTGVIIRRTQRGMLVGEAMTGKRTSEAEQARPEFWGLVRVTHRLASDQRNATALSREMFQTAQWAQSSQAAQSLAQMSARGAKGDPQLATLARERQDLVAEWQKRDATRSAAVAQPPEKRDSTAEAANVARLAAIDGRIAEIDKRLAADFPDYAALASPTPMSVEDVQAALQPDEALVLFLDTPEWKRFRQETFVWVVTKTEARWVRSELGTPALSREVAALRCGLDDQAWTGSRCSDLLKVDYKPEQDKGDKPLPFDLARAHALYKSLLGSVEDLITDKRLLIVPSGPLTQLPFQVLVTERPKSEVAVNFSDFRNVPWLIRKHPITVLPSVSSLRALRATASASRSGEPYVGFGNPLLDGDPSKYPEDTVAATLAREKRCAQSQRIASVTGLRGGTRAAARSTDGLVRTADIRRQAPLPETADELCDVARNLGVDPDTHLFFGVKATETEIKRLSAGGMLARYKIVHFATHGAVAGELASGSEPGLILTPPDNPTEADDGYLTASEIAALKLDADWVILSACNTAAGQANGAEALSGLARAFFYAGARSLLVTHWEVSSEAAVKLITKTVAEAKADPKIGRAGALRHSMLSLIDDGKSYEAHPAFWAPFVLVGEGRAAR